MSCGAETEANAVMAALLAGVSFTIPTVDLSGADYTLPPSVPIVLPAAPTNADLTTTAIDGSGTFDQVMKAVNAHLKQEFDKGRITGDQYAKVYLGSMESALANSVQFLLQRDQSYWTAVRAQYEAKIAEARLVQARVELATAKVQLAAIQYTALTQEANYALTKMKLSTESIQYCTAKYNLDDIMPSQKAMIDKQVEGQQLQNDTTTYNLDMILPIQKELATYSMEAARAQTYDTRTDAAAIGGTLGKQMALHTQQITSYQRDSEVKAAKLFTDAWITMKTIDEALPPPINFDNTSLNVILGNIKVNNNLD